jgi:GRIP domain
MVQEKCAQMAAQISDLKMQLRSSRAQAVMAMKEQRDELAARSAGGSTPARVSNSELPAGLARQSTGRASMDEEGASLQGSPTLPVSSVEREDVTEYWKRRCTGLQQELSLVQDDLADQMHVHELRDLADGARKLEIQELQAVRSRSTVNVEYLKNALIGFFEAGQLPFNEQVLVVLDRLLSFTAQDRARIWKSKKGDSRNLVSSLFGTT